MYSLSKLSFAASVIILLAFTAERLGILNMRYTVIIAIIAAFIQAALLGILLGTAITKYKEKHEVKIVRYQISNKLINGGMYILPGHMSPTNPRKSALFEVFLEIEDVEELPNISVNKTSTGSVKQDMKDNIINVKSGIVNDNFIFSAGIIVRPDEKINFTIEKDARVKLFILGEIYVP